jgi:hypothetical protein
MAIISPTVTMGFESLKHTVLQHDKRKKKNTAQILELDRIDCVLSLGFVSVINGTLSFKLCVKRLSVSLKDALPNYLSLVLHHCVRYIKTVVSRTLTVG